MKIDNNLLNPFNEYENRNLIFDALLDNLRDGMTFTLTQEDLAANDRFLIFSSCKTQVITIHTDCPFWVEFDGDGPMLLENCPISFYRTLLLNIKNKNYK